MSRTEQEHDTKWFPESGLLHTDLLGVAAVVVGDDLGHERAVLDVHVVTGDVDGVLAGLRGPVADVTGAVVPVLTLDLGLGGSLDGKT